MISVVHVAIHRHGAEKLCGIEDVEARSAIVTRLIETEAINALGYAPQRIVSMSASPAERGVARIRGIHR